MIQRRPDHEVPVQPGGVLSDYIPFDFTPYSPIRLNIKTGHIGIPKRPLIEIVILVSSLHTLAAQQVPFVFTDRHPYLQTAAFHNDLARLDCIAWNLLRKRDFKRDPNNPGKFEQDQAEALVHRHLPIGALTGMICRGAAQKAVLQGELENRRQILKVVVKPDWYF